MKLKWEKILLDPTFWILLIVNTCLLYTYHQNPEIFTTLIWLYWSQSVLFGIFNYVEMRTAKKFYVSGFNPQSEQKITEKSYAEANGWVFSALYAAFHIVYVVFLAGYLKKTGPFEWY